jgi:hypothetical protein
VAEENGTVRVLVAQKRGDGFPGFWAEFEGEQVASYEDPRIDKNAVYALYRCTAYEFEAYRVHVRDESNPDAPVYQLLPFEGDRRPGGGRMDYSEPWELEDVARAFPMFLKDTDHFEARPVDPQPRSRDRSLPGEDLDRLRPFGGKERVSPCGIGRVPRRHAQRVPGLARSLPAHGAVEGVEERRREIALREALCRAAPPRAPAGSGLPPRPAPRRGPLRRTRAPPGRPPGGSSCSSAPRVSFPPTPRR